MPANLKPLLLPQLVEEEQRKKLVEQQQSLLVATEVEAADYASSCYTRNSSSSDIASLSPVTPTFSRHGQWRFSGSVSSLELPITAPSSCSESPASPIQPVHTNASANCSKSQLPDVQEDPLEREDEGNAVLLGRADLYDCMCSEQCLHASLNMGQSPMQPSLDPSIDYDQGFLSDGDVEGSPRQKRKRNGSESVFSGWSGRLGSRFPGISRWRAPGKSVSLPFSPASDLSLNLHPTQSRAASSRSSSISAPSRRVPDRASEPPLPETPAFFFYDTSDGVVVSTALEPEIDLDNADVRKSLERDRAMATTPLLPPLLTDKRPSLRAESLLPSPLQSPSVAQSPNLEQLFAPVAYPTPPLSTKASISSFPRGASSAMEAPAPPPPPPLMIPHLLEHHDAWSDSLGHANFTITPKPFLPDIINMDSFAHFHNQWDEARINYTRHLVRTGEHYGKTSKTYALTQAKWAEIEREWQASEQSLICGIAALGNAEALAALQIMRRMPDDVDPAKIPAMLDDEGKFPGLGDQDIVGPMVRDSAPMRERKNSTSVWFKNLAEKVGLRK